ncbi:hypothetical protein NE237_008989 [Protea cynaroides]|uniref:Uncharacterized protein n=1 Tax=Protea cynaroides TaxID=273540 RepID=A0A9Q0R077_9MAGN|nr:hypothetical protein NE237_008989 [Protea cynaroides]
MADLKERLLPSRIALSIKLPGRPYLSVNPREHSSQPSCSGRPLFQGMDFLGLKKRGQGLRSWICVYTSRNSQIIEVDKFTMMRRCDLPARDLRLLDPLFVYPSMIFGREKAIVINLEQIRCIIKADEVFNDKMDKWADEVKKVLDGKMNDWADDDMMELMKKVFDDKMNEWANEVKRQSK